ncbi:MAG: hypothetical protein Q4G43_09390 [Mobilicoccus sp.]|nr:hypothetical protein [Mobilicoccus sp.]
MRESRTGRPRPAALTQIPRAAWVMARAFTPHPLLAVVTVPVLFMVAWVYGVRRALYLDATRTGVVAIARHRPVLDAVLIAPMAGAGGVAFGVLGSALVFGGETNVATAVVALAGLWFAVGIAVLIARSPGSMTSTVGPETPRENLHTVMAMSQLPGTRLTALLLARRVVEGLPPGTVVAAVAGDDRLARAYARLGFTPGKERRCHLVVGAPRWTSRPDRHG